MSTDGVRTETEIRELIASRQRESIAAEQCQRGNFIKSAHLREDAAGLSNDLLLSETFWACSAASDEQGTREDAWRYQIFAEELTRRLVAGNIIHREQGIAFLKAQVLPDFEEPTL